MARNNTKAMIKKLIAKVRKLPQANTAPCFFASAKDVAVTFDESGRKEWGEIEPAGSGADQRHDDVADQRIDDRSERGADDHAHGKINDIAAHGEGLEFLEHEPLPSLSWKSTRP